jgi:hypothetical protein
MVEAVRADIPAKVYPHKVAPECSCYIASICQHRPCCYYGEVVPENVRSVLVPPPSRPTEIERLRGTLRTARQALQDDLARWLLIASRDYPAVRQVTAALAEIDAVLVERRAGE